MFIEMQPLTSEVIQRNA